MPELIILSRATFIARQSKIFARNPAGILSINDPGAAPPAALTAPAFTKPCLILHFHDFCFGAPDHHVSYQDIRKIIRFAGETSTRPGPLYIHCAEGISRSAAAAWIIGTIHHGPGTEYQILKQLKTDFPRIHPNERMITLAQALRLDLDFFTALACVFPHK